MSVSERSELLARLPAPPEYGDRGPEWRSYAEPLVAVVAAIHALEDELHLHDVAGSTGSHWRTLTGGSRWADVLVDVTAIAVDGRTEVGVRALDFMKVIDAPQVAAPTWRSAAVNTLVVVPVVIWLREAWAIGEVRVLFSISAVLLGLQWLWVWRRVRRIRRESSEWTRRFWTALGAGLAGPRGDR